MPKQVLCANCEDPCGWEYPADATDPGFREGKGENFSSAAGDWYCSQNCKDEAEGGNLMEDLKPVPAREMLHQAQNDLELAMIQVIPNEPLHPRDYAHILKAAAAIKLLWEANRGY